MFNLKSKEGFKSLENQKGQSSVIGFFIGAMVAVIVALQVTWPVVDAVLNTGTTITNMSSSAQTLVNLIPLFLALSVVMIFIRPLL